MTGYQRRVSGAGGGRKLDGWMKLKKFARVMQSHLAQGQVNWKILERPLPCIACSQAMMMMMPTSRKELLPLKLLRNILLQCWFMWFM